MKHVLIIGGYGTFGLSIATLLAGEAGLTLTLAGRDFEKARAAAAGLTGAADVLALKLDRNADLSPQITTPPDIIIDASGPFQTYSGDKGETVIRYAIAHSVHYLDIADSLEFVESIHTFDAEAKAKNITMLSGLSTYPVLTAAAAQQLSIGMGAVSDIRAGIAPSPRSVMGRNVIAAIAGYAGKKTVTVRKDGKPSRVHGLTQTHRETICVPGQTPLPNILFSVVEGPDAVILPKLFTGVQNIWNSAGPRPEVLHRLMIGLAWIVRVKCLPNIAWLTGLFHKTQSLISLGDHRGGMFVRASNDTQSRVWNMVAIGDDGPLIPALPSVIMVKKWLRGDDIPAGARSAITDVNLADFNTEFSKLNITHGIFDETATELSLYEKILGPAYDDMSKPLQDLHRIGTGKSFAGRCKVTRGGNPLAKILSSMFRFPKDSPDIPVRVVLTQKGGKEIWERFFNGKRMISTQEAGCGKQAKLVIERFGPVAVHLAITVQNGQQHITAKGWSLFGVPMPRALAPGGEVFEHDAGGRFNFHVDLQAPILGRLVKYEGWLQPETRQDLCQEL